MKQAERFVVVVDAIVGCGVVYYQGHVLEAADLWGYAEIFVRSQAVRPLTGLPATPDLDSPASMR